MKELISNWIEIKNLQPVYLKDIPVLSIDDLRLQLIEKIRNGKRLVQLFGRKDSDKVILYAVAADDNTSKMFLASSQLMNGANYNSITAEIPAAHLFERELHEESGIKPDGHPWLKPVRKGIAGVSKAENDYEFFAIKGEEVHEVGVGPVHAGIIEPGHFRFSCHGEKVYHLEIELGFQHRGVENLFIEKKNNPVYMIKLAESIAGDSVIGHAGTFVRAMESLAGLNVSRRTKYIRSVMLELERIGNHMGDLAALSNDVAYLTGNAAFSALRTKVINTTMNICGNRFGRGMLNYGNNNFDLSAEIKEKILSTINQLNDDTAVAAKVLFSSASVMERFEKTGIVDKKTAAEIGMVGPAARASGLSIDVRSDHPYESYEFFPLHKLTMGAGDVFSRAYIRFIEIQQSIKIINELLNNLPESDPDKRIFSLQKDSFVISIAESWRGETAHSLITDKEGKIAHIKIKDPSFNNWFGLALAVRNEGISDFPLCNKSFNLSYCGFDL